MDTQPFIPKGPLPSFFRLSTSDRDDAEKQLSPTDPKHSRHEAPDLSNTAKTSASAETTSTLVGCGVLAGMGSADNQKSPKASAHPSAGQIAESVAD